MPDEEDNLLAGDSSQAAELAELAIDAANAPESETPAETPNYHPAFDSILSKIPESLRPAVATPLQEWQKSADERFREVHSTYEPYKQFVDNKIAAEELQQGYAMIQALQSNPRAVYDQMRAFYKFAEEQGQEENQNGTNEEQYDNAPVDANPEIGQLRTQLETVLANQAHQEAVTQAGQEIEQAFSALKNQHPDIDADAENYIGRSAADLFSRYPNATPEQVLTAAYGEYNKFVEKFQPRAVPPVVPRGNSSLPSNAVDPADMSPEDRQKAALELINKFA